MLGEFFATQSNPYKPELAVFSAMAPGRQVRAAVSAELDQMSERLLDAATLDVVLG